MATCEAAAATIKARRARTNNKRSAAGIHNGRVEGMTGGCKRVPHEMPRTRERLCAKDTAAWQRIASRNRRRQAGDVGGKIEDDPVIPHTDRCVGVIDEKDETGRSGGRAGPCQRR